MPIPFADPGTVVNATPLLHTFGIVNDVETPTFHPAETSTKFTSAHFGRIYYEA